MSDYERIALAIEYIVQQADQQPSLEAIAAHIHLSPTHFQRLFSRWAGVSPKRFLQVLTVERAKQLLSEPRPLLDVSHALGLSSGSRLYDHFVQLEAVTPGEFKTGGKGLEIEYAAQDTPFGMGFVATTTRGICNLEFMDGDAQLDRLAEQLAASWPQARLRKNQHGIAKLSDAIFSTKATNHPTLPMLVRGTNFQIKVWKALLQIPPGQLVSYTQVANAIGYPRAARVVGRAIGKNPVAFLIPCHRVIQQSGKLGGYHWGETRKHVIQLWEACIHK